MKNKFIIKKEPNGFVILLAVLVVGAVGLSVAVSLLSFGVDSVRTRLMDVQSLAARALAGGCAEEALQHIKTDPNYIGGGNLAFAKGNCDYNIINSGGTSRSISAAGTINNIIRKISISLDSVTPTPRVAFWQEVAD